MRQLRAQPDPADLRDVGTRLRWWRRGGTGRGRGGCVARIGHPEEGGEDGQQRDETEDCEGVVHVRAGSLEEVSARAHTHEAPEWIYALGDEGLKTTMRPHPRRMGP